MNILEKKLRKRLGREESKIDRTAKRLMKKCSIEDTEENRKSIRDALGSIEDAKFILERVLDSLGEDSFRKRHGMPSVAEEMYEESEER